MSKKIIVPIGTKFGRLTIIAECERRIKPSGQKVRNFKCLCNCGNEVNIQLFCLTSGDSRSCGCLRKETSTKHGMSKTRTHHSWHSMLQRCLNKNNQSYGDYGGRGVIVCEEWKKFENFYKDMGERPLGKSLDRIDNNGNYCKENCRWATRSEQQNNRRVNRMIFYRGKNKTMKQLSNEFRINYQTLRARLNKGLSIEESLKNNKLN